METEVSDAEYLDDLIEMFATPGWKRLVREAYAQVLQNQIDAVEAPNWDKVCEIRGENAQLHRIINLEPMVKAMAAQSGEGEDE